MVRPMDDHPCGDCLRWWECNGVAWGTPDCPSSGRVQLTTSGPVREALEAEALNPDPDPLPCWPKINPNTYDDRTTCGLLEED